MAFATGGVDASSSGAGKSTDPAGMANAAARCARRAYQFLDQTVWSTARAVRASMSAQPSTLVNVEANTPN
eukprot:3828584-Prymnesium_polylepis.1